MGKLVLNENVMRCNAVNLPPKYKSNIINNFLQSQKRCFYCKYFGYQFFNKSCPEASEHNKKVFGAKLLI